MIKQLAQSLNDLAKRLRHTEWRAEISKRSEQIEKPDYKLHRVTSDLDEAAAALESIKVYRAVKPLDWHEAELWQKSKDFRQHQERQIAEHIGECLLREGCIEFGLVDTDRPGLKAIAAETAVVTGRDLRHRHSEELSHAFAAGAEAFKQQLLAYIDTGMPNIPYQNRLDHIRGVIENTKAAHVQAPPHFRSER